MKEMDKVLIATDDLQALLDVSDGYITEHGIEGVGRYAEPKQIHNAIRNASEVIRIARGGSATPVEISGMDQQKAVQQNQISHQNKRD